MNDRPTDEQRFVPHNPPTHGDTAEHTYTVSDSETFAVLGPRAEIEGGQAHQGLFHCGTRHVSCLRLSIGGRAPIVLREAPTPDDAAVVSVMTNPPLALRAQEEVEEASLHLLRRVGVQSASMHQRLEITSYARCKVRFDLVFGFDADFADLFEVRGIARARRGDKQVETVDRDHVVLAYRGLDDRRRRTRFAFHPDPDRVQSDHVVYELELQPHTTVALELSVFCDGEEGHEPHIAFEQAIDELRTHRDPRSLGSVVSASEPRLDQWLQRSRSDLLLLRNDHPSGAFCHAGLPWFATLFGRDGLVTALQTLWAAPELAAGTLRAVAAHQATEVDPQRDAEPGKNPHELRSGEMAALGEIPFGAYYGSADATLLFVMLAGAHHRRTGDMELVRELWPAVRAALEWLETWADPDGDGLVEHGCSAHGLINQGWKDSPTGIVHADGTTPVGPIALAEVQGYAYAARLAGAHLASALGQEPRADELRRRAEILRAKFEERFWCEPLRTYVLALDGRKAPCRVRTSNAGHCLWTRIADRSRGRRVVEGLMAPDMFSGWGVRTLSAKEVAYNPMSYHRGSIWPHDCSLLAAGMAAYDRPDATLTLLQAMLDATDHFERRRLPELFCGFDRVADEPPTPYPSACAPQAWAAGAGFLFVASMLGLQIDAPASRVWLRHPSLPEGVDEMAIAGLQVGEAELDLHVHRHREHVGVSVRAMTGKAEVVVVP